MGFEFSQHTVNVEVAGKDYIVNMGNATMLDTVEKWGAKPSGTDYSAITEGRIEALTNDVRGYLVALLGEEQFASIFEGREFDFIDGLELFAYLYAELSKSRVNASFARTLSKYLPNIDLQDDENDEDNEIERNAKHAAKSASPVNPIAAPAQEA